MIKGILFIVAPAFIGGWLSKESCDYYYQHHIFAISVETGEQKEIVIHE